MNPQEVRKQIERDLQIENLPQEQKERIITELAEILMQRITVVIMSQLPEQKYKELDSLLQSNDYESFAMKLNEEVPNAPQIAEQVIKDGIQEYKQKLQQLTSVSAHEVDMNAVSNSNNTNTLQTSSFNSNPSAPGSLNTDQLDTSSNNASVSDVNNLSENINQEYLNNPLGNTISNQQSGSVSDNNPLNMGTNSNPDLTNVNNEEEHENFIVGDDGEAYPMNKQM